MQYSFSFERERESGLSFLPCACETVCVVFEKVSDELPLPCVGGWMNSLLSLMHAHGTQFLVGS
jgi:hypothetical protein